MRDQDAENAKFFWGVISGNATEIFRITSAVKFHRMKIHWIFKETIGALVLLGAIIYLPVVISDYNSPKVMPFRPKTPRQRAIKIFPSDQATRQAVMDILGKQLNAIRSEQFDEAYQYASFGIRSQIPLTEFERMVRIQFEPMLRYEKLEFSEVYDDGAQALVRARLSVEGIPVAVYAYVLALEENQWRVGGVLPENAIQTILPPSKPTTP